MELWKRDVNLYAVVEIMKPKTSFTLHALDRTAERLHLSSDAIADIIDSDKAVILGYEPGTRRVHLLLYSEPDKECFVAVQDERTKEVVTVLPLDFDFHRVSFYPPTKLTDLKKRAEERTVGQLYIPQESVSPANYFFIFYFRHSLRRTLRARTLEIQSEKYASGREEMERNAGLLAFLKQFAGDNCLPLERFEDVFVSVGRKGVRKRFALDESVD